MSHLTGFRTIPTFLDFHAASRPDAVAVIAENDEGLIQKLTWAEVSTVARQAGNWIQAQGLNKGDAFVLHIANSLDFYLLWLAAALTGTVAVPVDPRSTEPELHYIVDHSDARLVVTTNDGLNLARSAGEGCSRLVRTVTTSRTEAFPGSEFGREVLAQPSSRPRYEPAPLDVAGMLYTSGTTGRPKGVMLTHAAYLHGAEVFARATALNSCDRHLIPLPLHHAAAQCHAMTPSLVTGASIVIVERFRPSQFMAAAVRHRATRAALFATPLRMLLNYHAQEAPPKTKLGLITFAQNLTPEEMKEWETKFAVPLMQLWGMTETAGLPLMTPLHGPQNILCMGLPVAGYEVKIVNWQGESVQPGTPGEIVVRVEPGWTATSGYYKNPQATAELMRDGWLWTGDLAVQDNGGEFHFLSRSKEMIKRSGENISPVEIEDALKLHPDIHDAAVLGVPDAMRDERVIAFVIPRPSKQISVQGLSEWCRERLSAFKVPEEFYCIEEFPRTSVGKVQRHQLRDSYLRGQNVTRATSSPAKKEV